MFWKKLIISSVTILSILLGYCNLGINAMAGGIALGGLSAVAGAWAGLAGATGLQPKYTLDDLKGYGKLDDYGKFILTDHAGLKNKIIADQTALANNLSNTYNTNITSAINSYNEQFSSLDTAYDNLTFDQKYALSEQNYHNQLNFLDEQKKAGLLTPVEYGSQRQALEQDFNPLKNGFSLIGIIQSHCEQIANGAVVGQLEISNAQLGLFGSFVNESFGATGIGGISVAKGIQGNRKDICNITFPAGSSIFLCSEYLDGYPCYMQFSTKFRDGQNFMTQNFYDKSGQLLFDDNNNFITELDKLDHFNFTLQNNTGNFILHLTYLDGTTSDMSANILSTDTNILSVSKPLINISTGTVALPVDDVGIDIGNPSILYDPTLDKDTPIIVPIPDIDTIVKQLEQDLVDGKVNDLDIPDVIPDGLPNLIVSNRISEKFPFCVPFDFVRGIKLLVAVPEVPKVEKDLYVNFAGRKIGGKIILDFKNYEPVAKLIRFLSTLGFIMVLLFCTKKLMGGGN